MNIPEFADFSLRCAALYLGFGGPSGRIEAAIKEAGHRWHLRTEIMASPTGIYVSITPPNSNQVHTEIRRVRDLGLNLQQIEALEKILKSLRDSVINVQEAAEKLRDLEKHTTGFSQWLRSFAAFCLGAGAFIVHHGSFVGAFFAGLLTVLISWIAGPWAKKLHLVGIFGDFLACLVMLLGALIVSYLLKVPLGPLTGGSLIYLVPGLTLITAVSEFATYNYLSGTAKTMKGIFILLSLLLGFALVEAVVSLLGVTHFEVYVPHHINTPHFSQKLIEHLTGTLIFLVIFQVPKKAFIGSLFTGFLAFSILNLFPQEAEPVLKYFTASFVVGVSSLLFGYFQKLPSQCFSVPGIYSMLPGLMAFSLLSNVMHPNSAASPKMNVLFITLAVVFGLVVARMPFYKYATFKDDNSGV